MTIKRQAENRYAHITSFKDFRREKEILDLKAKIIDTRLSLSYMELKQFFSASDWLVSLAKEFILPKLRKVFEGEQKEADGEKTE